MSRQHGHYSARSATFVVSEGLAAAINPRNCCPIITYKHPVKTGLPDGRLLYRPLALSVELQSPK